MPAYKDEKRGTWFAKFYYTDWKGDRQRKTKRGFERKKDALAWEEEFLKVESRSCDMSFSSMLDIYMEDMRPRLRENTMLTKESIMDTHIRPFFKEMPMNRITAATVRKWQNDMLAKGFSPTYMKTIQNQLSAVFNYAVRYYKLPSNPVREAGPLGKKKANSMKFWTPEEFAEFLSHVRKFPARVGFSTLFWTGMRIGELLALSDGDIDLKKKVIHIRKSFQSIGGREVITEAKTDKGMRDISIPDMLAGQLKEYMAVMMELHPGERLFPFTKSYFHHHLENGCAAARMEKIRLHDLRHSHASWLINMKYPILLISERLGHENIETTLEIYGHLYNQTGEDAIGEMQKTMEKLDCSPKIVPRTKKKTPEAL